MFDSTVVRHVPATTCSVVRAETFLNAQFPEGVLDWLICESVSAPIGDPRQH